MKQFLWLGAVLFLLVIWTGCGDTFRPIIIPNPAQFPNPQGAHTVVTISDNGAVSPGSAMVIDVSADGDISQRNVGLRPVHEVQQTATQVLVVNQSTTATPQDSVSKLVFSGTAIGTVSTITLPASYDSSGNLTTAAPNFVATTESNRAYVSMPLYQPNQQNPGPVTPSVAVINTTQNTTVEIIPVGTGPGADPYAMVETPDGTKLYVANNGDSTVDGFNTIDQSPRTITGTFVSPLWMAARSDNQRVYVLNGDASGTLSTLDTHLTAGPDTVIDSSISVPGANYLWYDMILNRIYIPWGGQLTILDASQSVPASLAVIPVPQFTLLNLAAVPATAVAATSTPDGYHAYVASVPSSTDMSLPSNLTISSVSGDGTNATYTYTLTSGHDLTPGVTVTITGLVDANGNDLTAFEGTLTVWNVLSGTTACPTTCFQISNSNVLSALPESGSASGNNIFPQVTVINTSTNSANPAPVAIPGFAAYDAFCAPGPDNPQAPRFRFMMAAAGDSTRVYLSSCDGGNVNLIDTSTNAYVLNVPAPNSGRPPIPPSVENPPQNPVFMIAGP